MECETHDAGFKTLMLLPAHLEKHWTGGRWAEVSAWFGDARTLLFSDIPNDRML